MINNPQNNQPQFSTSRSLNTPVKGESMTDQFKLENVGGIMMGNRVAPKRFITETIPTMHPQQQMNVFQREMIREQESGPDASEKMSKDENFIFPLNNDGYHDKILNLLKINNNKALNTLYYKVVPQIKKNNLLALDMSSSSVINSVFN